MKQAWKAVPLGELCDIQIGGTPARKVSRYWDKDRSTRNVWLSIGDMLKVPLSRVIDSKEYLPQEGAEKVRLVRKGTLLVSFKLSIGRVCLAARELRTNEAITALTVLDEGILSKNHLAWYLWGQDWDAITVNDERLKGKTLNNKKLENFLIELPPIYEQQRIVAILDEAFAGIDTAIANTEKNLANARELFYSYLSAMLSKAICRCDEVPLERHIKFIDYRGRTPKKTNFGLRLITAKNVRVGCLRREPEEFVDAEFYESWVTRGIPKKGDVLFTTEAPLGLVCQLDTDEEVVLLQRVITMQPDRDIIDSTYLKFALRSAPIQARIHKQATGATATGIKASLLRKIAIPVPDVATQKQVITKVEGLEKEATRLESICQQKRSALAELQKSLLQKAFSGELTAPRAEKELADAVA